MNFVNYNGILLPANQPVLTIENRGFKYGDGLFESMRFMNGELKFAALHAERLRKGMKALEFDDTLNISERFLSEKAAELAERNAVGRHARVRLTVFRDAGGLYSPSGNHTGYAIEMSALEDTCYMANTKGLIADVYEDITKPVNFLSEYKTCNSLIFVMAGLYRKRNSLDDVFILNQNGFLCESMSSNIFVYFDKQLYTPALNEGCIAGVMRSVVMKLAADMNIPVVEAQISPDILNEAEEVFLTNAGRGIQWVMGFNNKRYFNRVSRLLLEHLNREQASVQL